MDTPHLLWGLLRWRATAQSSGFESCYIFVKKFTLLCRGVNSLIFAEDLGHSKPFFLFSFCGCKGVQVVPIGIFGELKHLSIGFPMHPWLGLDDVSALTWDLRRSGQDVGESWWQELASLCILLLNILKKSPEAAQNVFFSGRFENQDGMHPKKNRNWGCGNIVFFQWQFCGWSPPSRMPVRKSKIGILEKHARISGTSLQRLALGMCRNPHRSHGNHGWRGTTSLDRGDECNLDIGNYHF